MPSKLIPIPDDDGHNSEIRDNFTVRDGEAFVNPGLYRRLILDAARESTSTQNFMIRLSIIMDLVDQMGERAIELCMRDSLIQEMEDMLAATPPAPQPDTLF